MAPRGMLSKGRSHPLERWGFLILCLGQVGFFCILLGVGRMHRQIEDIPVLLVLAGFLGASGIGTLMVLHGRRRGAVQVMARAGRVCLRCRYPLPAAEDLGVCPECGDPFTHDDNVVAWRARYPWLRL
jgi:hypothetical protein